MTPANIFITGGTGVIGSALAQRCILDPAVAQIQLLVRATSHEHLAQRREALLAYWQLPATDPRCDPTRLRMLPGDTTMPRLGLDDATWQSLCEQVTHIVHAAGDVRLSYTLDEALAHTRPPAEQIITLCRTAHQQHQRAIKLDYLSTIGVAGRQPGLIPEQPLDLQRSFRNTYEQAKAEAEAHILAAAQEGLMITVHRPSMVVGEAQTGRVIRHQVFYHLCEFLCGRRTCGIVPDMGQATLDVVPVDWVAQALHRSMTAPQSVGQVLHLCAGPDGAIELETLSQAVRAIYIEQGLALPPRRRMPLWLIRSLLPCGRVLPHRRTRRALGALPYLLDYLDQPQQFANARTLSLLGLDAPPALASYLSTLLTPWLTRPRPGQQAA